MIKAKPFTAQITYPYLVSASQVSLFRECERKFALSYIAGLKTPPTPSQALGTEVDDGQLQPYLKKGTPLNLESRAGQIANAGLHLLPPPKFQGLEVQKWAKLPAIGTKDYAFQGYLDLWLPNGGIPFIPAKYTVHRQDISIAPGTATVADFKTTKVLSYAKKPAALKEDVQAQLYATWAMYKTGLRELDLVWFYFRTTDTPLAKASHVKVDAEHVAKQFEDINETAGKIFRLRKSASDIATQEEAQLFALEQRPNPEACGNWGGCQYQHLCNLTPDELTEKEETLMAEDADDFLAELKARKAKAAAPSVGAAVMGVADTDVPAGKDDGPLFAGINGPEKNLPPAPPVGMTEVDASPEAIAAATPKPKRGRPAKPKPPLQIIDVPAESVVVVEPAASPAQDEPATATNDYISINFEDGPFKVNISVMPLAGETLTSAVVRAKAALMEAFK